MAEFYGQWVGFFYGLYNMNEIMFSNEKQIFLGEKNEARIKFV